VEQVELTNLPVPSTQQVKEPVFGDIREDWDRVRFGIGDLLQRHPHLTFRPEDVYATCVAGRAVYWKAEGGFVISTVEIDTFTEEKTFLIWLAYAWERGNDNVAKHIEFFKRVTREAGIKYLEVRTNITAMGTRLVKTGWQLDHMIYRIEA